MKLHESLLPYSQAEAERLRGIKLYCNAPRILKHVGEGVSSVYSIATYMYSLILFVRECLCVQYRYI